MRFLSNLCGAGAVLALLFGMSSCSTFRPFGGGESENYNAITYGDDYNQRTDTTSPWKAGEATSRSVAEPRYPQVGVTARAEGRSTASFYENETNSEPMDPTDEQVRAKIESKRGRNLTTESRDERLVRADFYDNSPHDGSLWSNENDANYFFTKGKVRAMGDIISVKMEEPIIRQIAEEIKKSLTPAEQEVEMALYLKNSEGAKGDKDIQAYRNVAAEELRTNEAEVVKERMEKAVRWSQVDLSKVIGLAPNEEIRAEVIDRYQNGNYKIRAVKRVMYRGSSKLMSVVAVAPANDFDEKDVITSGKLYEHKVKVAR
jgi:hypothetical protein